MRDHQHVDPVSVLSLLIACIGAITGVVSLAWQIATRRRGVHRVTVRALIDRFVAIDDEPEDGRFIAIEIVNRGSASVSVDSYGIELADGGGFLSLGGGRYAPEMPARLDAGAKITALINQHAVAARMGSRDPSTARAFARLQTGETSRGKRGELSGVTPAGRQEMRSSGSGSDSRSPQP